MVDKKDLSVLSYGFGILSIVFAFFTPGAGLVIAIIGFSQSKNKKGELYKKSRKLNKIGIILSAIFFVLQVVISYLSITGAI